MSTTMLPLKEVCKRLGKSRSSCYKDIDNGLLTSGVPVGARSVRWPDREPEEINKARIAGKSDAEIKVLVRQLMVVRKSAA